MFVRMREEYSRRRSFGLGEPEEFIDIDSNRVSADTQGPVEDAQALAAQSFRARFGLHVMTEMGDVRFALQSDEVIGEQ